MTRLLLLLTATLCLPVTLSADEAPPKQPNILFIFCDDLGYGDVGVFHQNDRKARNDRSIPYFTTPNLDAMAEEGMTFKQHYCAAPVCAPSRASLLTGVHQGHATIRDNQFDKEMPDTHTFGSVLKQAGYTTTAIGKWGLQGPPDTPEERGQVFPAGAAYPGWPSLPIDRGFDDFFGYVRHRDGHYHYPVEDKKQVWHNRKEISTGMELCYTTDLFTAYAKKTITEHREKSPDQPFFVYLAYDTPHAILQNPPCAYPAGGGLKGGVQWIGEKGRMINTATGTYDDWMHPDVADQTWNHDKDPATAEQPWPEVQKRWVNSIRRIDDGVGDLLQLLDDLGIADNTLVIFSSDNGPCEESYLKGKPFRPTFFHGFGPFEGIKRDVLEGGLRVPTIVRWKGTTPAGSTSNAPSAHYDWLPTFAAAAGLPAPASSDGVSLLPTLTGKPDRQHPSTIYSEYAVGGKTPGYPEFHPSHQGKKHGQMQVVHVDGYKGLRTAVESADNDFEIYDVHRDPRELHNLAGNEGFDTIQRKMKARALQVRLPNPTAKRPYDEALIPPTEKPLINTGAYFWLEKGAHPWMPNLRQTPTIAQTPTPFSIPDETFGKPPYALKWLAAVKIPVDGIYQFAVKAKGHTMLFVHDIRLLDEGHQDTRSASLPLQAGWHPVELLFRSGDTKPELSLTITDAAGNHLPLNDETLRTMSFGW